MMCDKTLKHQLTSRKKATEDLTKSMTTEKDKLEKTILNGLENFDGATQRNN